MNGPMRADGVTCVETGGEWECELFERDVPEVGGFSGEGMVVDDIRMRNVNNVDTAGRELFASGPMECDVREAPNGKVLLVCAENVEREYGGERLTEPY